MRDEPAAVSAPTRRSAALLAVALFVAIVLVGVYLGAYNALVTARQDVADSRAVVELELQDGHDLIPHSPAARSRPEQDLAAAARAVVSLRERHPA